MYWQLDNLVESSIQGQNFQKQMETLYISPCCCVWLVATRPGFIVFQHLPDWAMLSSHHTLCCPLLFPLSIFPTIRVFSKDTALCIWWPKYWGFSFSISSSDEYSELMSFRIDWFDLLAVWETLKSLLQHHHLKASVLLCSIFFMAQLSHPYMTAL